MKVYLVADAGGGRSDGKTSASSTGTKVKPAGKLGGKKNTPIRTKKPKR